MKPNKITKASVKRNPKIQAILSKLNPKNSDSFYESDQFKLYGYYGSEIGRCMAESNFETVWEDLGGDKAKKQGWISRDGGSIQVRASQPLLIAKLVQLEDYVRNNYPILDDGDFHERERESQYDAFETYKSEFLSSVDEVIEKHGLKVSKYTKKDKTFFAEMIFEEACGYSGLDAGWVDVKTIERPLTDYFCCSLESHLEENSKLYRDLIKKIPSVKREMIRGAK